MNSLKVFSYFDKQIRTTIAIDGPWLVAEDVCDILSVDLTQSQGLDDDEKGKRSILTPDGNQEIFVVNESGLYSLILKSQKPETKQFKRWITNEVLPVIKKMGCLSWPN